MTSLAVALLGRRRGMGRPGGAALVLCYVAFVAVQLVRR
jgi:hypothetical protein